ncbi:MAG TPA: glycosyltransferase [Lacunisphaera sp.]|nr:glycosyltransferase [Lacunisphaera sp.]
MKRVLIVSPHFPPVNAPDMQRVRMSLPYFAEAGWEATVLTVDDPTPTAPVEPELLATVPADVPIVRARCLSRTWTRWLGIGNVALRALPFLFRRGCRLLAARRYDVVYFSTTMFTVLPLGRIWRCLYGVPYVIDLQDPWVTDFYARPGAPPPPGGWKYGFSRSLGSLLEGWTLRRVSQLVTVSAAYGETLRERYPELRHLPVTELPFGSPDPDLQHVRSTLARRPPLLPAGPYRLAFAGAIGPGMLVAVEVLVAALAELRKSGVAASAHFYGTTYSHRDHDRRVTRNLADKYGVPDLLHESPGRLPYFQALQVTLEADVNLLFGSQDLAFTPSKLLALLAAGRPILAIAHGGSALAGRLAALGQPCVIVEGGTVTPAAVQATVARLHSIRQSPAPAAPASLSARATAIRQATIFAAAAST